MILQSEDSEEEEEEEEEVVVEEDNDDEEEDDQENLHEKFIYTAYLKILIELAKKMAELNYPREALETGQAVLKQMNERKDILVYQEGHFVLGVLPDFLELGLSEEVYALILDLTTDDLSKSNALVEIANKMIDNKQSQVASRVLENALRLTRIEPTVTLTKEDVRTRYEVLSLSEGAVEEEFEAMRSEIVESNKMAQNSSRLYVAKAYIALGDLEKAADVLAEVSESDDAEISKRQTDLRLKLITAQGLKFIEEKNWEQIVELVAQIHNDPVEDKRKKEIFVELASAYVRAGEKDRALQIIEFKSRFALVYGREPDEGLDILFRNINRFI